MEYLKLLRTPKLLLLATSQVVIQFFVVNPILASHNAEPLLSNGEFILVLLATIFTVAGGFVINDYYDMKIDEINRPLTRIVGKNLSRKQTMMFYMVLTGIAVLIAGFSCYLSGSKNLFFLFLAVIGVLWFYSSSYKRMLIVGNFLVSLSVAMIPMIVIFFNDRLLYEHYPNSAIVDTVSSEIFWWGCFYSLYVFGWIFVNDIIRTMSEEKGEREMECHTIPVVYGMKTARIVASSLSFIVVVLASYALVFMAPYGSEHTVRYLICTILPLGIGVIYLISKAKTRTDYNLIEKIIIFLMVFGFCYNFFVF